GPSSLNGTYAFVTSGEAIASGATSATPFSRTGSFTANGSGVIQGGVYDLVDAGGTSTTSSAPNPIMGGSYTVSADGRGTLTFNVTRSEEHTSELQSRGHLVCRLLLEKKKTLPDGIVRYSEVRIGGSSLSSLILSGIL